MTEPSGPTSEDPVDHRADPGARRAVPSDSPPSVDVDDPGSAPADESARQAQDTVRSISRLEESN